MCDLLQPTHLSIDGADYVGNMGQLTFESGSTAGDVDCVNIGIINDACKERNESFVFALCAGGEPFAHIDAFFAGVYIVDEEGKFHIYR